MQYVKSVKNDNKYIPISATFHYHGEAGTGLSVSWGKYWSVLERLWRKTSVDG